MNISVGLISHSFAWEQLLLQEGVPFTVVDLSRGLPADEVSVVAINRPIAGAEIAVIEQFLRHGGAVLGAAHHLEGVSGITSRQEWIEFLIPDGEEVLHGLSILDLGMIGSIPREANTLRTQGGTHAVLAGELDSGLAVVLPFDPESALVDMRVVGKSFYARRERLPGERVSLVAKGEIHHLIHAALEFLHHRRGIPYAHLWYFPGDAPSVFIFRIDTDNASTTDIEALYATSREFGIGMTWFLDVRSHQRWLEHFAAMTGQEIGVHCFEHRVFESYEENLRNIRRAREMLELLGIRPMGFAAPFGGWNPALAKAVDSLGFLYSSEFSLAYDAFPMHASTRTGVFNPLQIPIHPICPGSLTKIGYSEDEATRYFAARVDDKLSRDEAIIFYHHPGQRAWKTIRSLFTLIRERKIDCITMGEYARWWNLRLAVKYVVRSEGNELFVEFEGNPAGADVGQVKMRVSPAPGKEMLVSFAPMVDIRQAAASPHNPFVAPADLRRARDFDPRALLGDLYTKMTRRYR